jgi:hypothetical protein
MRTPSPARPAARAPQHVAQATTPTPAARPQANDNADLCVVERIAEGGERTLDLGAWHLVCAAGDDEPRVRDIDAAECLGFKRPRKVRDLIERIWPKNKRPDVRPTVGRASMPRGGTREVTVKEYWLTEAELLKVIARSETPVADAILDDMIRVYMAVRRYLLTHPARRVANDADPLHLDRAAQFVDVRPSAPIATRDCAVLVRTSTGRAAMERELLTVGEVTFVRWQADPDSLPRIRRHELSLVLGVSMGALQRIEIARGVGGGLNFLPTDAPERRQRWLSCEQLSRLLPDLADLAEPTRVAKLTEALSLVREHIDTATVHVRAHHRRSPGTAQAMVRTLPLRVEGGRVHLVLTPREVWMAVAVEDLYSLLGRRGVNTESLRLAIERVRPYRRRGGIWRDPVGVLLGQLQVQQVVSLMFSERGYNAATGHVLDRVLAFFKAASHAADKVLAKCRLTDDWSAFAPRSPLVDRPALDAGGV